MFNKTPLDVSYQIFDFLPVPVQLNINKTTKSRSTPKARKSIYKIRSAMKFHRNRMCKSILFNNHSIQIQRSSLSLYLPTTIIEKCLNHILKRGDPEYIQDTWTMCMDDRNGVPYPETIKDGVILGHIFDLPPKKIFRTAISQMDRLDLDSLMLMLDP